MSIEFTHENDEGEEVTYVLPSKFEVCNACDGHGTHLNRSIGEHAYTSEEFHEAFFEDEDKEEYFRHGGKYDVTCEDCKGNCVVPGVDEDACIRTGLKEVLALYYKQLERQAEYARERACGQDWKADKAAGKIPAGTKWPQYWSECNKRKKAAGM